MDDWDRVVVRSWGFGDKTLEARDCVWGWVGGVDGEERVPSVWTERVLACLIFLRSARCARVLDVVAATLLLGELITAAALCL